MIKYIITTLLTFTAVTASAIDEKQFHSGTAVLKGRILNKPTNEWNFLSIHAYDFFTDQEQIHTIPVADDGTFEGSISLTCSQNVLVLDITNVFLAVGDTMEVTKDAQQAEYEGITIGGKGKSADINRLWPEFRKHYFGDRQLFIKDLPAEKIPAWKKEMVGLIDQAIADIEADRLPLPAGTDSYVKEVLGANLLAEPFLALMDNYRYNMTGGRMIPKINELGDYYDFLSGREKWLLDNSALLLSEDAEMLINRLEYYMMPDFTLMRYAESFNLKDDDYVNYYQQAAEVIKLRYGIKSIGFMGQTVLCHHVFMEREDDDFTPGQMADVFAAAIPLFSHPVAAYHALQAYRQYVKQHEGDINATTSSTPEGDAVFQRIIEPYKGNALYIDFWGMGCAPCRTNMLNERDKVEQMKDLPVRFLYICDEKESPRERAEQWMHENHIKGEHIYVTHEEWQYLSTKFQFNAIPFQTALDMKGNFVTQQYLNRYFQELMKSE